MLLIYPRVFYVKIQGKWQKNKAITQSATVMTCNHARWLYNKNYTRFSCVSGSYLAIIVSNVTMVVERG